MTMIQKISSFFVIVFTLLSVFFFCCSNNNNNLILAQSSELADKTPTSEDQVVFHCYRNTTTKSYTITSDTAAQFTTRALFVYLYEGCTEFSLNNEPGISLYSLYVYLAPSYKEWSSSSSSTTSTSSNSSSNNSSSSSNRWCGCQVRHSGAAVRCVEDCGRENSARGCCA